MRRKLGELNWVFEVCSMAAVSNIYVLTLNLKHCCLQTRILMYFINGDGELSVL